MGTEVKHKVYNVEGNFFTGQIDSCNVLVPECKYQMEISYFRPR